MSYKCSISVTRTKEPTISRSSFSRQRQQKRPRYFASFMPTNREVTSGYQAFVMEPATSPMLQYSKRGYAQSCFLLGLSKWSDLVWPNKIAKLRIQSCGNQSRVRIFLGVAPSRGWEGQTNQKPRHKIGRRALEANWTLWQPNYDNIMYCIHDQKFTLYACRPSSI